MTRTRTKAIVLMSAFLSAAAAAESAPPSPPKVFVETGALRGVEMDGVLAFKGIPFAKPPVGPLRWRAPQPATRWKGIRDASFYQHDCMQTPFPSDAAPIGTTPAENCLYANVWRPVRAARPLPVMVWIYGGGFVNGGASPLIYSGAELAKQGILVFSFNYRLGRFGTFAHPLLTKANADHGLRANYGYMDQVSALRWVQRNIAAFGGDPANVTIVGESAGGIAVHTLITSPITEGLFRRAVVQSGGPIKLGDETLAAAEATGVAFAQSKGIADDDPDALDKLRNLSAEQVDDGLNMAALFTRQVPRTFSSPIVDGALALDSVAAYRSGRFKKVPMMVGATSDDIGGPAGMMITGARTIAQLLAAQGVPIYYYRFSYVASSMRTAKAAGAKHATDIPFFFGTAATKYGIRMTSTDRAVSEASSRYLVNFVKTGDPNGIGLPLWNRHTPQSASPLNIDATIAMPIEAEQTRSLGSGLVD